MKGRRKGDGDVRDIVKVLRRSHSGISTTRQRSIRSILSCCHEGIDGLDIVNEGNDIARKDKNQGDDAQDPDDVQPDEDIYSVYPSISARQ